MPSPDKENFYFILPFVYRGKAIELGSSQSESFYYRAQCYLNLNKKAEALTDLKNAIELGSKEAKELYEMEFAGM